LLWLYSFLAICCSAAAIQVGDVFAPIDNNFYNLTCDAEQGMTACLLAVAMPPRGQALDMDSSEEQDPTELLFATSQTWHQFPDDQRKGLFRNYATVLTRDGQTMVDLTNVFLMNCQAGERYFTMHFPERFKFASFTPSTQMSTEVRLHDGHATTTLAAELRDNEFVMPLSGRDLDAVIGTLKRQTFQALLGPEQELVNFSIGDELMDNGQGVMLDVFSGSRKQVTIDRMRDHCAQ
jgi:hypothetical protein